MELSIFGIRITNSVSRVFRHCIGPLPVPISMHRGICLPIAVVMIGAGGVSYAPGTPNEIWVHPVVEDEIKPKGKKVGYR